MLKVLAFVRQVNVMLRRVNVGRSRLSIFLPIRNPLGSCEEDKVLQHWPSLATTRAFTVMGRYVRLDFFCLLIEPHRLWR